MTSRPCFDVVSIGESMIRLSTPNFERLSHARSLDIQIGGAESNLAVNLSRLGLRTSWISRLPDNGLGHLVIAELNANGVDTSGVRLAPDERMGTYFIELAVPPRPNRVIYDRAGSAASRMSSSDIDFDVIASARWLHTTGITAAISTSCRLMTADVLKFAREHGLATSFDVNYRALLWSPEVAGRALAPLLDLSDTVFMAHRDAIALFAAPEDPHHAAQSLRQRHGCKAVVLTLGEIGAVAATVGETIEVSQQFKVPQIVDRIGAGDAFDAGFIAAQLWGHTIEDSLNFGNAMSALKITIPGDLALVSRDEVEQLVQGAKGASVR
jgi:2-dehydro-3-deoxygluconokinase